MNGISIALTIHTLNCILHKMMGIAHPITVPAA